MIAKLFLCNDITDIWLGGDEVFITESELILLFAIELKQVRAFVKPGFFQKIHDDLIARSFSASEAEKVAFALRNIVEECHSVSSNMLAPNLPRDFAEAVACAQNMDLKIVTNHFYYLEKQDAALFTDVDGLVEEYRLAENEVVVDAMSRAREVANTRVQPQLRSRPLLYGLRQWFCQIGSELDIAILAATGWQSHAATRDSVSRTKKIEIEGAFAVYGNLVLQKHANDRISILPQLKSKEDSYLPEGLQLTVVDEFGESFNMATAEPGSNLLQLDSWLEGDPGTQFSVRVSLGDAIVIESFCI